MDGPPESTKKPAKDLIIVDSFESSFGKLKQENMQPIDTINITITTSIRSC